MLRAVVAVLLLAVASSAGAQDFSGAWTVAGTDPTLGAFTGSVNVRPAVGGVHDVTRLVELATLLPDGRKLALAWRGEGRVVAGALRVSVALRRREFLQSDGLVTRTAADAAPLALAADLRPALAFGPGQVPVGAVVQGNWGTGSGGVQPSEQWTRVAGPAPDHPVLERRLDPCPVTVPRRLMFALFRDYHRLPGIAPWASRPEFQGAVHLQMVDTTALAWTRAHPDHVVVVQKVADSLGVLEETLRANCFRWSLAAKAQRFDREMLSLHVEPATGMLGAQLVGGGREVHGDSALHQGVWVGSQMWRFLATGDQEAARNVELGTRAILLMVDAPGDPAQFGRAVMASAGPSPKPGWARSTAVPGIDYIPGGNNDMCHGVDYGFVAAERTLPAGHPMLVEVGAKAKQLVEHSKVAQGGKHEMILSGVAARLTGDSGVARRYRRLAYWSPLEMLWLSLGEGIGLLQEVSGRSGPHLASTTINKVRLLGGQSPNLVERLWRRTAERAARVGYEQTRTNRPGNLAAIAAATQGPAGSADMTRAVLAEVPCPRPTGTASMDWSNDPSFCMSPYPSHPWKFDFMTNVGRQQPMVAYPLWWWGNSDNWWKEGPYGGGAHLIGLSNGLWSSQDYLHAYWVARQAGVLSATE